MTVLYIYGNLFYAAADTFEKSLPAVEGASRAVVILLLRGYEDVGSTVIEVLRRYTQALQANGGKLILAGVAPALRDQLQRTGMLKMIGEENIFLATETIGEAGNTALRAASDWLAADRRWRAKTEGVAILFVEGADKPAMLKQFVKELYTNLDLGTADSTGCRAGLLQHVLFRADHFCLRQHCRALHRGN